MQWVTNLADLASINGVALTPDGDVLVLGSAQNREDLEVVHLSGPADTFVTTALQMGAKIPWLEA